VELNRLFKRLVPQALRGRWGQTHSTEEWFLNFQDLLTFRDVWVLHFTGVDYYELHDPDVEFGLADEDPSNYRKRMSKWKQMSLNDAKNLDYWTTLRLAHTVRQPIEHARRWLMKPIPDGELPRQVQWTCKQIAIVLNEVEERLKEENVDKFWSFLDHLDDQPKWCGCAALLLLQTHANFTMREVTPNSTFALALAWMVAKPAAVVCEERSRVAKDLLRMSDFEIHDVTTLKLRIIFVEALEFAATSGLCDIVFYALIYHIFAMMRCDTQWIEGVNSIIKNIIKRCPGISWALLCHRIKNNHTFKSVTAEGLDEIIEECVARHKETMEETNSAEREHHLVTAAEIDDTSGYVPYRYSIVVTPTVHQKHAAKFVTRLKKEIMMQPSHRDAIRVTPVRFKKAAPEPNVWMPVFMYNRKLWVARFTEGVDAADSIIQLDFPVVTEPLVRVFERYHAFACEAPTSNVMVDHVGLAFDLRRTDRAHILWSMPLCDMKSWCCARGRGRGRGGGRGGRGGGRGGHGHEGPDVHDGDGDGAELELDEAEREELDEFIRPPGEVPDDVGGDAPSCDIDVGHPVAIDQARIDAFLGQMDDVEREAVARETEAGANPGDCDPSAFPGESEADALLAMAIDGKPFPDHIKVEPPIETLAVTIRVDAWACRVAKYAKAWQSLQTFPQKPSRVSVASVLHNICDAGPTLRWLYLDEVNDDFSVLEGRFLPLRENHTFGYVHPGVNRAKVQDLHVDARDQILFFVIPDTLCKMGKDEPGRTPLRECVLHAHAHHATILESDVCYRCGGSLAKDLDYNKLLHDQCTKGLAHHWGEADFRDIIAAHAFVQRAFGDVVGDATCGFCDIMF